ncbi:DUF2939 domain-containing protein [Microbulbifer sp. ALW1]|uniref:DUF2939 domain-containing protein n=1 Tax=Microbulbifer sp. (strain ALW1) TaxID=1516059 RepID=UPI001357CC37|nr:DUF2939 domain-containing protein [Microbulbifer sp. ALW1]
MGKWLARGSLLVILLGVVYAALPWYSARQLIAAAQSEDVATLERYVDFPTLRSNILQDLREEMRGSMGANLPPELDGLFTAGSDLILKPLVERLVSPQGISDLIQGRRDWRQLERNLESALGGRAQTPREQPHSGSPAPSGKQPADSAQSPESAERNERNRRWQLQSWAFSSVNTVEVTCGSEAERRRVQLQLRRDGLRWRLVDISLINEQSGGE